MINDIFQVLYHYGPWLLLILGIVGLFTNWFGLGDLRREKGNWYRVTLDTLPNILKNLDKVYAFKDSDGMTVPGSIRVIPKESSFKYEIFVPEYCVNKVERKVALEKLGLKID